MEEKIIRDFSGVIGTLLSDSKLNGLLKKKSKHN
jgi:hypothetical protein